SPKKIPASNPVVKTATSWTTRSALTWPSLLRRGQLACELGGPAQRDVHPPPVAARVAGDEDERVSVSRHIVLTQGLGAEIVGNLEELADRSRSQSRLRLYLD